MNGRIRPTAAYRVNPATRKLVLLCADKIVRLLRALLLQTIQERKEKSKLNKKYFYHHILYRQQSNLFLAHLRRFRKPHWPTGIKQKVDQITRCCYISRLYCVAYTCLFIHSSSAESYRQRDRRQIDRPRYGDTCSSRRNRLRYRKRFRLKIQIISRLFRKRAAYKSRSLQAVADTAEALQFTLRESCRRLRSVASTCLNECQRTSSSNITNLAGQLTQFATSSGKIIRLPTCLAEINVERIYLCRVSQVSQITLHSFKIEELYAFLPYITNNIEIDRSSGSLHIGLYRTT